MRREQGKVELGAAAPDFTLPDLSGRDVVLSAFRGTQHVLLVFSRGFF